MNPCKPLSSKIARFLTVGVANTILDWLAFSALLLFGVHTLLANTGAWAAAVSFSYLVNSRWTFERATDLSHARSAMRFAFSGAVISLGTSTGVLLFLASLIGVWPAKILGTIVAAILNFVASRWSIEDRIG